MNSKTMLYGALALAAVGGLVWLARGGEKTGQGIGGAAGGVVTGFGRAIGNAFGLPDPDPTKCQLALQSGSAWDKAKWCKPGEVLDHLFGGNGASQVPRP